MASLNKFMWLRIDDALMIFEEQCLPADGKYRMIGKYDRQLILEPVSIGHHVKAGPKFDTEITGLVVRDQRGWLWQALHESGRFEGGFVDEVRGFVRFTRVTEQETRRVFREVL